MPILHSIIEFLRTRIVDKEEKKETYDPPNFR